MSEKRTRKSKLQDWRREWRSGDNDEPKAKAQQQQSEVRLSQGISPSRFHKNRARAVNISHNPMNDEKMKKNGNNLFLRTVLQEASTNVIRQERRQVSLDLKLKRVAFKEVTSLKTWPLQELALKDLDSLQQQRKNNGDADQLEQESGEKTVLEDKNHGDSTGLSSSSFDEPKRHRRFSEDNDKDLNSPRKNTLRHQYRLEFMAEQAWTANDGEDRVDDEKDVDHQTELKRKKFSLQPALWCMEPRIFSVEKPGGGGKRKYLVGHLGRFLDFYWRKLDPKNRHHYELIRESTPCRLYFDLEFNRAANPDLKGLEEDLMTELYLELRDELQNQHNLHLERKDIVDLDSSTPKKFSRHWIVHLREPIRTAAEAGRISGEVLFSDTASVGRFVKAFVGRLAESQATGSWKEIRPVLNSHLFVHSAPSKSTNDSNVAPSNTCFIDLGVYTRNRLFRLLASTKIGKPSSAALRIADANEFPFPEGFTNASFYVPAIEEQKHAQTNKTVSLSSPLSSQSSTDAEPASENDVAKGDHNTQEVTGEYNELSGDIRSFKSSIDFSAHAEAVALTMVVPMNASKLQFRILEESSRAKTLLDTMTPGGHPSVAAQPSTNTSTIVITDFTGTRRRHHSSNRTGPSPFSSLDHYVLSTLSNRGGVQGTIRSWSINYADETEGSSWRMTSITFQLSGNRWCEFIGRPHRSNNIMWTIDFQHAPMTASQRCWDPECRLHSFRGTPIPLPEEVQDEIRDILFEQELAKLDETELLKQKSKSPHQSYQSEPGVVAHDPIYPIDKKATPDQAADITFDEEEFEKALLALDLNATSCTPAQVSDREANDGYKPSSVGTPKSHAKDASTATIEANSTPFSKAIPDACLLEAIQSNPDLFP